MPKIILTLLVNILFISQSISQSTTDITDFKSNPCFIYADSLSWSNNFKQAINEFKLCLAECKTQTDSLIVHTEIARQYLFFDQSDTTINYLKHRLPNSLLNKSDQDLLAIHHGLLVLHFAHRLLRQNDHSIRIMKRAINTIQTVDDSHYKRAFCHKEIAIAYWRKNRIDSSIFYINQSNDILNSTDADEQIKRLKSQNDVMLGLIYSERHENDRSIIHYKRALHNYLLVKPLNYKDLFINCTNIANEFLQGSNIDSTLKYLQLAKNYSNNIPVEVITNAERKYFDYTLSDHYARTYLASNDLSLAKKHSLNAQQLANEVIGESNPDLVKINSTYINILIRSEQFEDAIKNAEKNFALAKEYYEPFNSKVIEQLNLIAESYIGNSDYTEAKGILDSILAQFTEKHQSIDQIITDEIYTSIELYLKLYDKSNAVNIQTVDELYNLFLRTHSDHLFHFDGNNYHDQIEFIINRLYTFYANRYLNYNDVSDFDKLINISELRKGRSLLNHMILKNGMISKLDPALRINEKLLRDSISQFSTKSFSDSLNQDSILAGLKIKHKNLLESFYYKDLSFLYELTGQKKHSIQKIKEDIPPNQLTLTFFENDEFLYCMYINKEQHILKKWSIPSIESLISHFHKPLFIPDSTRWFWNELNVPADVESIEIVPDGTAWSIQFEALCFPANNTMEFVGSNYDISYQYSLTSKNISKNKVSNGPIKILGVKYPPDEDNEEPLPGSKIEFESIRRLFGPSSTFITADKEELISKIPSYPILHLGVHAQPDTLEPDYSTILLDYESPGSETNLYSYEIDNLILDTELVVLSSCLSGAGSLDRNEGIRSLGRSFLVAGVESVLVSRNKLIDGCTPFIIGEFYKFIKRGHNTSQALKLARRSFIENKSDNITIHPRYWNSFYLIGVDRQLTNRRFSSIFHHPMRRILIISLGMLILILGSARLYRLFF